MTFYPGDVIVGVENVYENCLMGGAPNEELGRFPAGYVKTAIGTV